MSLDHEGCDLINGWWVSLLIKSKLEWSIEMSLSCGLWSQVRGNGKNLALSCASLSEELAWLYAPATLMFIPTLGPDPGTMTWMSRNYELKETPASFYVVSIKCFVTAMWKVIYTSLVGLWVNIPKLCLLCYTVICVSMPLLVKKKIYVLDLGSSLPHMTSLQCDYICQGVTSTQI